MIKEKYSKLSQQEFFITRHNLSPYDVFFQLWKHNKNLCLLSFCHCQRSSQHEKKNFISFHQVCFFCHLKKLFHKKLSFAPATAQKLFFLAFTRLGEKIFHKQTTMKQTFLDSDTVLWLHKRNRNSNTRPKCFLLKLCECAVENLNGCKLLWNSWTQTSPIITWRGSQTVAHKTHG